MAQVLDFLPRIQTNRLKKPISHGFGTLEKKKSLLGQAELKAKGVMPPL
jgi:hypothetical protein